MDRKLLVRIGLVLAIHLWAGTAFAVATTIVPPRTWPITAWLPHSAFLSTELTLVGICAGLPNIRWWLRGVVLSLGMTWQLFLFAVGFEPYELKDIFGEMAIRLLIWGTFVAVIMRLFRRYIADVTWRSEWRTGQANPKFSIRSLFASTALVGAVLWGGQITQSLGPWENFIYDAVVAITWALIALITTWAALGRAPFWFRVTSGWVGVAFLALVRPLYAGGTTKLEFYVPLLIELLASAAACASLLAVRSCDYRLVSKRRGCDGSDFWL